VKRIRLSNREIRQLREASRFMAPALEGADVVEIVAAVGERTPILS